LIPSLTCSSDSLAQGSPYGSILEFNEDNVFPDPTCPYYGWNVRSSGTMTNGRGYSARMFINPTAAAISGTLNNGNVSNGGLSNSGGTYGGFHIVANPYPSPMAWTPPTGFASFMYAWQTSGLYAGSYQSYPPGTSVASMQGFFAKVNSGTVTYAVNNSMRISGDPGFWRTPAGFDSGLEIIVSKDGVADKTSLAFNDNATELWDEEFDAMKLPGNSDRPSLYSRLSESETLYNVNSIPSIKGEKVVPLGFTCGDDNSGVFDFEFKFRSLESTLVYLVDNKNGTRTRIEDGTVIPASVTADDAIERFSLHFNPSNASADIEEDNGLFIFNNSNGQIEISSVDDLSGSVVEVYNVLGDVVYTNEPNGVLHTISIKDLTTGIYVVHISGNLSGSEKLFIR